MPLAKFMNGKQIGRFGQLQLVDVTETKGKLRIGRLSLSDAKGPYLVVQKIELDWQPTALVSRTFHITRLKAASTSVLRKPVLKPALRTKPPLINVRLDSFTTNLRLAADVFAGAPSISHQTNGQLTLGRDNNLSAKLASRSIAGPSDELAARVQRPRNGKAEVQIKAIGGAGSMIGALLGTPDAKMTTLDLFVEGDAKVGVARGNLTSDIQKLGAIDANWTESGGIVTGFAGPSPASWVGKRLAVIGGRLDVSAQLGKLSGPQRDLTMVATAPALAARFDGPVDFERSVILAKSVLTIERSNLSTLTRGRVSGLLSGRFDVAGEPLSSPAQGNVRGVATIIQPSGFGLSFVSIAMPIDIAATSSRLAITSKLTAQMPASRDPRFASLGSNPQLDIALNQNRARGEWSLTKAQLTGRGMNARFTGRVNAQLREVKGRADLSDVASLVPSLSGPVKVALDLRQTTGSSWEGQANVNSNALKSSSPIISQVIGKRLDASIRPMPDSAGNVFAWRIDTAGGRSSGSFNPESRVPLRGTWSLNAPLATSGVAIGNMGRGGSQGQIAFGSAGLAVGGDNARIAIGGWNLENARFLAVGGTAQRPLAVSISGIAPLGPANISGLVTTTKGQVSFTNIIGQHAGLDARGSARSVGSVFDGAFNLKILPGAVLVRGSSFGRLGISVRNGRVGLAADLLLDQAGFRNAPVDVPSGRLRAAGLLGALALTFDGDVRAAGRAGKLSLNGSADLDGRDTSLTLNGRGNIGGRDFVLSQPFRAVPLGTTARLTGQAIWGEYRLGIDGKVRDGGLDVRQLQVTSPSLNAQVAGRLGGARYQLRGSAQAPDLSKFAQQLRGGATSAVIIEGGANKSWRAQVTGRANSFSVGNADADKLLGITPNFQIVASSQAGRTVASTWRVTGKQLTANGTFSPAADLAASSVQGAWRITGPITLSGVDIVGNVDGGLALRNRALAITAASPTIMLAGQSWSDLRARAQFADIFAITAIPLEVTANGALGPLSLTTSYVGKPIASLQSINLTYGGLAGRGALNLGSGGPSGTLQLLASPGAFLTSGNGSGFATIAQTGGSTQIEARLALSDVTLPGAGVSNLTGTLGITGPLKNLIASLDARFALQGHAASALLTARLNQGDQGSQVSVTGGGNYQGAPWRLAEPLIVATQNKVTRVGAQLVWRSADLNFEGVLRPDGLVLAANLKDAPASLFAPASAQIDGRITGTVNLRSQGGNVVGEGRLLGTGIKPRSAQAREAVDGTIIATLQGGEFVVRGTATNARGLRATGDARLPVRTSLSPLKLELLRNGPVSGQFEILGPVEAIAKLALSRNSTASGTINARGQLSGTMASPRIQGRGEVNNAALNDASLGIRLSDANAIVNFLGPIADIERASASDGRGGKIEIGGRIAFTRGASWRLAGQMDKFQIIGSSEALIVATGPWSLASDNSRLVLGGELTLDNARIGIPASVARADILRVREINRPSSLPPLPSLGTSANALEQNNQVRAGQSLGLNLAINSNGNTRVVSRGFDGNFDVDITAKGTLAQPQVAGRAELVRGRFDLAGRSFDMTRGTVRFLAPLTASQIDFIAQRETADITALAKIQGTLGRPVFRLESTPAAPQDEVLSRILFGRNVAALSLPQAAQLALGVSSLTTGNQLDPTVRLGQALGLERFSIGTDSGGFGGFTAGLRLVRDVYVEVTTGGADGTVTMLEWRPRRRVQVQVTTSQNRESSVSIRLRSKD